MSRTMYDSVTAYNIPASAQMVAGYVDGRYAWSAADWARFPSAVKVRIACFPWTNDGHVLDVEAGDATPAQAPGWVQMRRGAGVDPTVYCSASWWPSVRAAFQAAGVPEPHYWVAAYPGIGPNLYPGSVAHQYADPGPYDLSVVADYWPGVDGAVSTVSAPVAAPAPVPAPAPVAAPVIPTPATTTPEDIMAGPTIVKVVETGALYLVDVPGGVFVDLTQTQIDGLQAVADAHLPIREVTGQEADGARTAAVKVRDTPVIR